MRDGSRGPMPRLLGVILLAALFLTGCQRGLPGAATPLAVSTFKAPRSTFTGQPPAVQLPLIGQPAAGQPATGLPAEKSPSPAAQPAATDYQALGRLGILGRDLPAMTRQLDGSGYQLQVVPSSSQAKADRIAREWAADAQQLYVIWAYWKLPILSITRHAYYSPSKRKALKVEFTVSSLFEKSVEEEAEGFDQASIIMNEARDHHAYGVKEAHAIAKRMGYVPSKYGAAVLLDLKTHGPFWVFADMPTQTEGTPVMLVNAESGMVTQGGEAMLIAEILFKRAGY